MIRNADMDFVREVRNRRGASPNEEREWVPSRLEIRSWLSGSGPKKGRMS